MKEQELKVFGIEFDISRFVRENPDIKDNIVKGNIENLPFSDSTFSVIHTNHNFDNRPVYYKEQNQIDMFWEIMRVLEKGGVYIANEPHMRSQIDGLEQENSYFSSTFFAGGIIFVKK